MKDECTCLARGRFGEIKRCVVGCTHLTFASASLHFDNFDEFLHFAETVVDQEIHPKPSSVVDVAYKWITIRMNRESFNEMASMIRSAIDEAAWWDGDLTAESLPGLTSLRQNLAG